MKLKPILGMVDSRRSDMLFANVVLAYERLSPGLRRLLVGLEAEHSARILLTRNNRESYNVLIAEVAPPVVHPVVRTNPDTGRKGLFVNPTYTERFVGMTDEESRPLLDYLFRFATQPEFVLSPSLAGRRRGDVRQPQRVALRLG